MAITYQKLAPVELSRLQELIALYARVFEMQDFTTPGPAHLQTLLDNQQILFYVATDEQGKVIGGLTAYSMPSVYYEASEIYIYDLAVETHWQRQGIGRQLITALKTYGKSMGVRYIFVQADLVDQHAIDFYQSTGGIREEVVHFDYQL